MLTFLSFMCIIISSLISVAFFTLLERKVLGYIQIRKGPNKVGMLGIFQPFSDAIKLFSKLIYFSESANPFLMSISPNLVLLFSVLTWMIIPFKNLGIMDFVSSTLVFFIISSLGVYSILLIGWSSNSKYCYLGAIRSVAQMISYEVSLFLIIISVALLCNSYSLVFLYKNQFFFPFLFLLSIPFILWFVSCLAETNRSPFDFAEGESELVSGFNVEYMGGWFAMIFMAEYLSIITLSFMTVILFIYSISNPMFSWFIIMLSLLFLWIRGTFPRFRYDLLMNMNWMIFLPLSISFIFFPFAITFFGL